MSSKEKKYIFILLGITILVVFIRLLQPQPIDWSEGYSNEEKKPYGGYILFNELSSLFPNRAIEINDKPIFEYIVQKRIHNQVYLNSNFEIDEFEMNILLNSVKRGNNVFISAWQLSDSFSDSLNLRLNNSFPAVNLTNNALDSILQNPVTFTNKNLAKNTSWTFPVGLTETYIASFDTSSTTILGLIDNERVNFARIDVGNGSIFIHTNPYFFTNYFLRDIDTFRYAFTALSYLPKKDVIWDEYYKVNRVDFSSPLSYVVLQPNLRWAWFISLFGLIIYLIFGAKRKQRIIPELKAVSNTSIQFTTTIANLYMNNGTHKELLEKKILFFKDYIRNNLNIKTDDSDDSIVKVSNRSGIDLKIIKDLFSLIHTAEKETTISSNRLKQVTDQIDWFYKNSLR